ncbi:phage virion morphogenesis protein [Pararhodobacter marinus]|uniref:Phage virion morphogenesis protein n=1 Tax=Pararhodobacter marinus TaxID=2184063 RepID=A0A2U2CAT7_9RHOB|nr:phage virion morphogenesis protein [Pararhodobacter marinus]PWE28979.1 phage virion morphogenesis protein [Pararhodobacter marinus]
MIALDFNDTEIQSGLDRLARAVTDMTPVMADIGEAQVVSTRDRFMAGTAPDGTPWAPKSPATIAAYERRRDPVDPRPLFGPSHRLRSEITSYAGTTSVEWGTNVIYAAVMQFGAAQGEFGARMGRTIPGEKRPHSQDYFFPIPWGPIPARPFLGLSDEDRNGILEALEDWLTRAWDGE